MSDQLLLLTATPHHGDDDRFGHFVRLLDPDVFPEPHKLDDAAGRIRRDILSLGPDCPWALRRLKEDLKDLSGRRLFPDRHASTVTFRLNGEEFALYKAHDSVHQRVPAASDRKTPNSVALARTVFQRRLASSTWAIHESLARRQKKLQDLLEELENLTPAQRSRRIAQLQGRLPDTEQDEDDLDEAALAVLTMTLGATARAAMITVNSLADTGAQNICVLRGALAAANSKKATNRLCCRDRHRHD